MTEYTVIVLGASAAKSELVDQFSQSTSVNLTECQRQLTVDGAQCSLVVREPSCDFDGDDLLSKAEVDRLARADALIIWYSITDRDDFEKVRNLCIKARSVRTRSKFGNIPIALNDRFPVLLFAINPADSISEQWKVTWNEGNDLAKDLHCNGFIECALRPLIGEVVRNESVERAMADTIKEIRKVESSKLKQTSYPTQPLAQAQSAQSSSDLGTSFPRQTFPAATAALPHQTPTKETTQSKSQANSPRSLASTRPGTASSRTFSITRRTSMIFDKLRFGSRKSSMESDNTNNSNNRSTPNLLAETSPNTTSTYNQSPAVTANPTSSPTPQNSTPSPFSRPKSMVFSSLTSITPTKSINRWGSIRKSPTTSPTSNGNGTGNSNSNGYGYNSVRRNDGPPKIELGYLGLDDWRDSVRWPTSIIQE